MNRPLRLKPTSKAGTYTVFEGQASEKETVEGRKAVTPVAVIDFPVGNMLSYRSSGPDIMYFCDPGYVIDGSLVTPVAHRMAVGQLRYHVPSILTVVQTPSQMLITRYRANGILEALPGMNLADMSDARAADDFLDTYHERARQKPRHEQLRQYFSSLFSYSYPQCFERYKGKIPPEKLAALVASCPQSMDGHDILPEDNIDLVIAASELGDPELKSLLADPSRFDILAGRERIDTSGIVRNCEVIGNPRIVYKYAEGVQKSGEDAYLRALVASTTGGEKIKKIASSSPLHMTVPTAMGPINMYGKGIQFLGDNVPGFVIQDAEPYAFSDDGVTFLRDARTYEGIAGVSLFVEPVTLPHYFSSPEHLKQFHGNRSETTASQLFDKIFKPKVDKTARRLEKEKGTKIKGVLLSDIHMESRPVDLFFTIQQDPFGEFVLAATYLV